MNINISLFVKATNFAAFKHRYQKRKANDLPYINHPIEVANIIAEAGIQDTEILCAAVLHDTLEDTQTTAEQLQKEFGDQIYKIVQECSDDKSLGKAERKMIQIEKAKKASAKAKIVKIADKLSNNRDLRKNIPNGWTNERVLGYHVWSYAVCQNLKGVNEKLDLEIQKLFCDIGVTKLKEEEIAQRLESYCGVMRKAHD